AATAIVGGKVLTGATGNAFKALPFVGTSQASQIAALPPAKNQALPPARTQPKAIDIVAQEQSVRAELAKAEKAQDVDLYSAASKQLTAIVSQKQESRLTQSKPAATFSPVEILPSPLESLTNKQLYAVARQEGVKAAKSTDKKSVLIDKIQRKVPAEKVESIVANIDQMFDKKGQPIGGFDSTKESEMLARVRAQEKAIHQKIAAAKKLKGADRIRAIEPLEIEAREFSAQLDQLQSQVLSPKTSGELGKMRGRVEQVLRYKPESVEARENRIAATRRAKQGPTYGADYAQMVQEGRGYSEAQTIDVVPTRLARASDRTEGIIGGVRRRVMGLMQDPTAQGLAATGASMMAGPIGDGIHPIAGVAARLGASNAVKVAAIQPRGNTAVEQVRSFVQSDKAKSMATEAVIAASGML
ncbi:MAG: hypothetical protein ACRCWJ_02675, partial [Casimicrobium sp.]